MSKKNEDVFLKYFILGGEGTGKKSFLSKINKLKCTEASTIEAKEDKEVKYSIIKMLNIKKHKIYQQAFIPDDPEPVYDEEDLDEEDPDYEIEKKYKVSFKQFKKSIYSFYSNKPMPNNNLKVINVFILMFDLSDFDSFYKLEELYKVLSLNLDLEEDTKVIIGNKFELKVNFSKKEKNKINALLGDDKGNNYYEISTKSYFDFEKFYSQFIVDILTPNCIFDKSDVYSILKPQLSFNLAERKSMGEPNDVPGPGEYNCNIYTFNSNQEARDVMSPKNRFNKKIFMNKIGPVYRERNQAKLSFMNDVINTISTQKKKISSQFSKAGQFLVDNFSPGYSFGTLPGTLNLRDIRSAKRKEINDELRSSFELEQSNHLMTIPIKKDKTEQYFEDINLRRENFQRNLSQQRLEKRESYNELQKENYKKISSAKNTLSISTSNPIFEINVLEDIKEKQRRIQTAKKRYLDIMFGNNSIHLRRNDSAPPERKSTSPSPPLYDTRGNMFNPKKGFSIVSRKEIKNSNMNYSAPYIFIKSEFDKIAENIKSGSGSYAPRLTNLESIQEEEKEEELKKRLELEQLLEKKWNKYEQNKHLNEKSQHMDYFIEREREKMKNMKEYLERIKKEEEKKRKEIELENIRNGRYNGVNFSLVEENSPKYSITGRWKEHREIDNLNEPIQQIDNYQSNPNFDYNKPSILAFSFGKERRFQPLKKGKEEYMIFKDEKFGLDERVDFSCKETFDSNYKREVFKINKNPGPGEYTLKGMADYVIENAKKVRYKEYEPPNKKDEIQKQDNATNEMNNE